MKNEVRFSLLEKLFTKVPKGLFTEVYDRRQGSGDERLSGLCGWL